MAMAEEGKLGLVVGRRAARSSPNAPVPCRNLGDDMPRQTACAIRNEPPQRKRPGQKSRGRSTPFRVRMIGLVNPMTPHTRSGAVARSQLREDLPVQLRERECYGSDTGRAQRPRTNTTFKTCYSSPWAFVDKIGMVIFASWFRRGTGGSSFNLVCVSSLTRTAWTKTIAGERKVG